MQSAGSAERGRYSPEQMHRMAYTQLTEAQIDDKLRAAADGPASDSALSDVFAGQSLRIVTDNGPTLSYSFATERRLSVAENNGASIDAG